MSRVFEPLPPVIFLDMDGVCCQWTETVLRMYGHRELGEGDKVPYLINELLGLSEDEMWANINQYGVEWWANLPPYPWFRDLFSRLQAMARVVILTSPDYTGNSAKGKVLWIRKHIDPDFRDYVMTAEKYLCARPGAVLVDDSDEKLEKFARHGGGTVVFPQPWNSGGYCKPELIVDRVVSNVRAAFLRDRIKV